MQTPQPAVTAGASLAWTVFPKHADYIARLGHNKQAALQPVLP
jgi:hypothetical protein